MNRKKYLGIDYGDQRVGLALAEEGSIALPYKILQNNSQVALIADIKKIISEEDISQIVVGLPHSLSGQTNARLQITEKFVDDLRGQLDISVATVDEQLTSVLFERQGVRKDLDKYAAAAILETYLNQQSSGQ